MANQTVDRVYRYCEKTILLFCAVIYRVFQKNDTIWDANISKNYNSKSMTLDRHNYELI